MQVIKCKELNDFVQQTTDWCQQRFASAGQEQQSIFLPTGSTPIPIYQSWNQNPPKFFTGKQIFQLDDISTGPKQGEFLRFLQQELSSFKKQIIPISQNPHPAGLAVLGVGLNGHVAFHEPGLPADFFRGEVKLSTSTCQSLQVEFGTKGLSFGVAAFMQAKSILLLIRGESKKEIFQRFLKEDPADPQALPVSLLKAHQDITVIELGTGI